MKTHKSTSSLVASFFFAVAMGSTSGLVVSFLFAAAMVATLH